MGRHGRRTGRRCRPALVALLRAAYPEAIAVAAVLAPHGYRVLVVSREFLRLSPEERVPDLDRRLGEAADQVAVAFLATPEEEWSGEWPFTGRRRFLDPKVRWYGVA